MTGKKALITGITGMDGSYLAEFLLSKGYTVIGCVRPGASTTPNGNVPAKAHLVPLDITDADAVGALISREKPDEIYSLAAVSDYAIYTKDPVGSHAINGHSPVLLMEACRVHNPTARLFIAGTCQAFGKPSQIPQDESTPFAPPNPYAISKVYAHHMAHYYRSAHGLFVVNGVLFNHESPRRLPSFVTRKISAGVAAIKKGKSTELVLGNLDARRDWGYVPDFVNAFWLTLQQEKSDDYVIGTGEQHTIREFVTQAFLCAGITDWERYVKQDQQFMRATDADFLQANPSRIKSIGWKPTVGFKDIVKMMVEHDLKAP